MRNGDDGLVNSLLATHTWSNRRQKGNSLAQRMEEETKEKWLNQKGKKNMKPNHRQQKKNEIEK